MMLDSALVEFNTKDPRLLEALESWFMEEPKPERSAETDCKAESSVAKAPWAPDCVETLPSDSVEARLPVETLTTDPGEPSPTWKLKPCLPERSGIPL